MRRSVVPRTSSAGFALKEFEAMGLWIVGGHQRLVGGRPINRARPPIIVSSALLKLGYLHSHPEGCLM